MGNVSSCLFCCFLKILNPSLSRARAFCKKKSLTSLFRFPRGEPETQRSFSKLFDFICSNFFCTKKKSKSVVVWLVVVVVDFCCCSALGNLWPVSLPSVCPRVVSRSLSLNLTVISVVVCQVVSVPRAACKQCHANLMTSWNNSLTPVHSLPPLSCSCSLRALALAFL